MMHRLAVSAAFIILGLILLVVFWQPVSKIHHESTKPLPADKKIWELRLGHNMPTDSALHEAAILYAKTVAEKSRGRIHITVYPNQLLGSDPKMIEMARRGTLDIILIPTAKMGAAMPSMQYVDLPFYFPAREDTYAMLDGEPGHMLLNQLKQIDLVGVTFWENGFKHFTANTPLHRPDDFKGKKFRIMESRLIQAQFEALGAKTLAIDFHKVRQALADGVVDGQENPLIAIKSMRIDEVQKHLTLSSHGYMGYVFCISAATFKSLPSDLQTILYKTGRELTPFERNQTHKREAELLKLMAKKGLVIHTLDKNERAALTQKMAPVAPRFEEVIGPQILAKTQELLLEKYGPSPQSKQQIAIGLSADLSMGSKIGGLAIKRGAELAIEEINAHGGVLGKPLVLIAKDSRAVAGKGVDNVKAFITRDDVVAIMGGVHSDVVAASIEEAQKAPIPFLIAWASSPELTATSRVPNVAFRISANNRDAIAFMTDHLFSHYRSPAVMYENSIWGRGALKRIKEISASRGQPLADAIMYNIGQTDFEQDINRLKHSHADSLLLISNSIEGAKIVNTLDRLKLHIPIVSHWGITANRFFETANTALKHNDFSFFQTFSFQTSSMPKSKLLAHHYMAHYGLTSTYAINAPTGTAHAYDLIYLLARAIQKAGTTDRTAVRNALENLGAYDGAVRRYDRPFTPHRHDALTREDYLMARFRSDGAIIPVRDR